MQLYHPCNIEETDIRRPPFDPIKVLRIGLSSVSELSSTSLNEVTPEIHIVDICAPWSVLLIPKQIQISSLTADFAFILFQQTWCCVGDHPHRIYCSYSPLAKSTVSLLILFSDRVAAQDVQHGRSLRRGLIDQVTTSSPTDPCFMSGLFYGGQPHFHSTVYMTDCWFKIGPSKENSLPCPGHTDPESILEDLNKLYSELYIPKDHVIPHKPKISQITSTLRGKFLAPRIQCRGEVLFKRGILFRKHPVSLIIPKTNLFRDY